MTVPIILIAIGLVIFIGHYLLGIFERKGIPDVLGLMAFGILLGPIFHILDSNSFGIVGATFSNIVLVLVLFESGILLRVDEIRESFKDTVTLTTVSFVASAILIALLTWLLFDLSILSAIFIGTALGGTSSAVVIGLVQKINILPKSKTTLILESTESDIFTLAIPLSILGLMVSGDFFIGGVLSSFISGFVMALLIGGGGAIAWSALVEKVPNLKSTKFSTIAFVCVMYGIVEFLNFSGPLAVLSFGVTLGNIHYIEPRFLKYFLTSRSMAVPAEEKTFLAELVFLLRVFFFIFIGASMQISNVDWLMYGALITASLFLLRILIVSIVTEQSRPLLDKATLSVMIPKGLGSAVIATLPLQQGFVEGSEIQAIGFSIILFSTVFCSILFFLIRSGVSMPLYALVFSKSST